MANRWEKIGFAGLIGSVKDKVVYLKRHGALIFLPVFWAYGLSLIFLIKIGQMLLT